VPAGVPAWDTATSHDAAYMTCVEVPTAIPLNTLLKNISGSTITLCDISGNPVNLTATIPAGSTLLFQVRVGTTGQQCSATNTAFFGMLTPYNPDYSFTATNCLTDSNPQAHAGFTVVPYRQQLRLASEVFGGRVDGRPLPGNVLQAGTYLAQVPTDIYGVTRRNPPTVGAIENVYAPPMVTTG
jgi:hypothetical protein